MAIAYYKSVMRIPNSHVNSAIVADARKEELEREDHQKVLDAESAMGALGGSMSETKAEQSDYWDEIMRNNNGGR